MSPSLHFVTGATDTEADALAASSSRTTPERANAVRERTRRVRVSSDDGPHAWAAVPHLSLSRALHRRAALAAVARVLTGLATARRALHLEHERLQQHLRAEDDGDDGDHDGAGGRGSRRHGRLHPVIRPEDDAEQEPHAAERSQQCDQPEVVDHVTLDEAPEEATGQPQGEAPAHAPDAHL